MGFKAVGAPFGAMVVDSPATDASGFPIERRIGVRRGKDWSIVDVACRFSRFHDRESGAAIILKLDWEGVSVNLN